MHHTVTKHNSNSPTHGHTHTQRLKSCGHLSDNKHWSHTHTDGASKATPNPFVYPAENGRSPSFSKASALLIPKHGAACQKAIPSCFFRRWMCPDRHLQYGLRALIASKRINCPLSLLPETGQISSVLVGV